MFQSFLEWLDEQISDRGLGRVIVGPFAILSAAGTLGTLFGNLPLELAAALILAVTLLAIIVSLESDRGRMRTLERTTSRVLSYTLERMAEERAYKHVRLDEWHEKTEIGRRGDATVTRQISLTVTDFGLTFLSLSLEYYGIKPQSERVKRKVRTSAHYVNADGSPGARLTTTSLWKSERRLEIIVLFMPDVIDVGDQLRIVAKWFWPLFSQELIRGGAEDFTASFKFPTLKAKMEVEMLKEREKTSFNTSAIRGSQPPRIENSAHSYKVALEITSPTNDRLYGFRVDKDS